LNDGEHGPRGRNSGIQLLLWGWGGITVIVCQPMLIYTWNFTQPYAPVGRWTYPCVRSSWYAVPASSRPGQWPHVLHQLHGKLEKNSTRVLTILAKQPWQCILLLSALILLLNPASKFPCGFLATYI
jgi:hypothetical protein